MKTTAILLLGILLAFTACEKEVIEPDPPDYIYLIGSWDLYHVVDGVSTNEYDINGDIYTYKIKIFNKCQGEFVVHQNGNYYWYSPFNLDIQPDSLHFGYYTGRQPMIMLPEQGWVKYLQYDNVLLIGYQQWLK